MAISVETDQGKLKRCMASAKGMSKSVPDTGSVAIATAPFDRDLQLAVIDYDGVNALMFPCRRILGGWMKSETKQRVDIHPTHWRDWKDSYLW